MQADWLCSRNYDRFRPRLTETICPVLSESSRTKIPYAETRAEAEWQVENATAVITQLLRSSRPTVDRLIHSGRLKAVRIGRRYFISQRALDDFITAAEQRDGSGT